MSRCALAGSLLCPAGAGSCRYGKSKAPSWGRSFFSFVLSLWLFCLVTVLFRPFLPFRPAVPVHEHLAHYHPVEFLFGRHDAQKFCRRDLFEHFLLVGLLDVEFLFFEGVDFLDGGFAVAVVEFGIVGLPFKVLYAAVYGAHFVFHLVDEGTYFVGFDKREFGMARYEFVFLFHELPRRKRRFPLALVVGGLKTLPRRLRQRPVVALSFDVLDDEKQKEKGNPLFHVLLRFRSRR